MIGVKCTRKICYVSILKCALKYQNEISWKCKIKASIHVLICICTFAKYKHISIILVHVQYMYLDPSFINDYLLCCKVFLEWFYEVTFQYFHGWNQSQCQLMIYIHVYMILTWPHLVHERISYNTHVPHVPYGYIKIFVGNIHVFCNY